MKTTYGLPEDQIDNNPLENNYAFKFKKDLWFINFSSNSYLCRESRNLGSFMTLAMQTLRKSDEYFKSDIDIKARAQKKVRHLAKKFDGCPVHPGLGPVIDSGKFSPAKLSYFIGDTNEEASFEPWYYLLYQPKLIIIDEQILSIENQTAYTHISQLLHTVNILILKDNHSIFDIPKYSSNSTLFISNNRAKLKAVPKSTQIATFQHQMKLERHCFSLDYFYDLLALHKSNNLLGHVYE